MKKLNPNTKLIIEVVACIYIPLFVGMISLKSNILPFIGSDAVEYKQLSESILTDQVFTLDYIHPEIFRTPGYPLFLAISKGICGTYWASILIQILCTLGISLIIFKIGSHFFSSKKAVIAGLLFILEPSVIIYTLTVASDILFIFLFMLSIYLLMFREAGYKNIIFSGILLGYATLTRPISLYFIPLMIIFYFLLRVKDLNKKQTCVNILVFCISFSIILAPWIVRNYRIFKIPTLSSLAGYNMFHYNLPEFYSFKNNISADEARIKLDKELPNNVSNEDVLRRGEYMNILKKISLAHIRDDFWGYTIFHLAKTIPFFLSSSIKNTLVIGNDILGNKGSIIEFYNISSTIMKGDIWGFIVILKSELIIFVERFLWIVISIIIFIPLFLEKEKIRRLIILFFILTIFYFAILTGPVSYVRYRLPAEPFMFILGVWGIGLIWYKIRK